MNPSITSRHVLDQWTDGINRGAVSEVLSLYAPDAILLPTFSSRTLFTAADRRDYFERLASREDLSVSLHEKTVHRQITGSLEIISGIYCFRFSIDGEILSFEARFSYGMDLSLSAPILHHHSSQVPRQLP
jgi:hypothetical protein